jgi:cytochrome c2
MKSMLLFFTISILIIGCDKESNDSENSISEVKSIKYSQQAVEGEKLFASCFACHNPELDPPLAAPMYGIQRRYKRTYGSKEEVYQCHRRICPSPCK